MPLSDSIIFNPSRRDLLKQLLLVGGVASTQTLWPSLALANKNKGLASADSQTIWRNDADYETWRRSMLWKSNAPSRFPDVIVQAKSEQEVIEALHFADKNDLQLVCRASGHNASGSVLRNGGMLLDISALDDISVDAEHMVAYAQPGAKMIHLTEQLNRDGFDFPIATCHTVALGGYLLGGGNGPNAKHWGGGPACYSILSADIILASGEKVTASKDENPDLYWAVRGVGPGFFGVVTRFKLQVYPSPKVILRNIYTYPIKELPQVIASFEELAGKQDARLDVSVNSGIHPDAPEELAATVFLTAFVDEGPNPEAEAMAILAPYANSAITSKAIRKLENKPVQLSQMSFTPNPTDRSNQDNFNTDDASAFIAIAKLYKGGPKTGFLSLMMSFNRYPEKLLKDASFSAKGRHHVFAIMHWHEKNEDEMAKKWFARFDEAIKPYARSHYVNEVNHEFPERIRNSYSKQSWKRLSELRKKYDPQNRFYSYLGY